MGAHMKEVNFGKKIEIINDAKRIRMFKNSRCQKNIFNV